MQNPKPSIAFAMSSAVSTRYCAVANLSLILALDDGEASVSNPSPSTATYELICAINLGSRTKKPTSRECVEDVSSKFIVVTNTADSLA
jgi:hypothetical protein